MRRYGGMALWAGMLAVFVLSGMAQASDCPSPGVDCENTGGHDAGVSIVGSVIAITAGLLGKTIMDARKPPA